MRLWILVSILIIAVGIAYWTVVQRHRQAQRLRTFYEAYDSFEHMHYSDAEAQLRTILPDDERAGGPRAAQTMNLLALVYDAEGRKKEAEPLFETAIQIYSRGGPSSRMDFAKACTNAGKMYGEERRLQEAEQKLQQALAVYQKQPAEAGAELGSALHLLALVREGQKRDAEAQTLLEQAVHIYESSLSPSDLNLAQGYLDLAAEYRAEGLSKIAQEMDQKALVIQEQVFGSGSPAARKTRARLGQKSNAVPSELRSNP